MRQIFAAAGLAIFLVNSSVGTLPANSQDAPKSGPSGAWRAVEVAEKPVEGLTLDYDGEIASGTGGCNQFRAPVLIEKSKIKIGPIAATRKTCSDKAEIEDQYFAGLELAKSFVLEKDTLILKAADGTALAKFTR